MKLVSSAGHSRRFSGATCGGVREEDITLAFELTFKELCRQQDIECVVTRPDDKALGLIRALDLRKRVAIADKVKADCFIEWHANSPSTTGGMEIVYPTKDERSKRLAQKINDALVLHFFYGFRHGTTKFNLNSRGILGSFDTHEKGVYVLDKQPKRPRVLIEVGFITSEKDRRYMQDKEFRIEFCSVVLGVVREFLKGTK